MFAGLRRPGVRRPLVVVASPREVLAAADPRLLGTAERVRSEAFRHPADREAYVAAHLLVRGCAALLTGRAADGMSVHQWCTECGTAGHGRPSLAGMPDVQVGWAHTRGAVVAAAAWDRVGVDVEELPRDGAARELLAVLTPAERSQARSAAQPSARALRYWVRKECLVKAGEVAPAGMAHVDLSRVAERIDSAGRSVSRYRGLHLVDWWDPAREVQVAVAGAAAPLTCAIAEVIDGTAGWSTIL